MMYYSVFKQVTCNTVTWAYVLGKEFKEIEGIEC